MADDIASVAAYCGGSFGDAYEAAGRLAASITPPCPEFTDEEISDYCEAAGKHPQDFDARVHAQQQLLVKHSRGFDARVRRIDKETR